MYLWDQGWPVVAQKRLEGFHRRYIDYLSQNGTARILKAYCRRRVKIAAGGIYRHGRIALCGLDG